MAQTIDLRVAVGQNKLELIIERKLFKERERGLFGGYYSGETQEIGADILN